jgi:hypothetical protein
MNVLSERISNEQLCESTNCPFDCNNKLNVSEISEIKEFYLKLNPEGRKDFIFLNVKREKRAINFDYKYKLHYLQES